MQCSRCIYLAQGMYFQIAYVVIYFKLRVATGYLINNNNNMLLLLMGDYINSDMKAVNKSSVPTDRTMTSLPGLRRWLQ